MTETLTDSERDVLTAAARRPDGRIHPLPEGVDADLIVGKLVSLDLIERVPDERPASEPFLRINYKGLKALHAGPDERATAARPTAVEAFIAAKLEFDDLLERLKDKSDDHFDVDPERVDWGHVGTLNKHLADLREIGDAVFKEGEFAEPTAGHDGHAFNQDGRRVAVCVPTD